MKDKKTLLVTGASSDVGSLLIENIIDDYDRIWAHYCNSKERVNELRMKYGEKISPIQADFGDCKSTHSMIDAIEASGEYPDHIVHLPANKPINLQFHKHIWNDYQSEMDVSLRSIIMILQQFIPYMSKQKYGKVVFMLTSYLTGLPPKHQSPYITAKYALLGLMKSLASEYASKGIVLNSVSPDMIETRFISELPEFIKEKSARDNPLGRVLLPQEVVPSIVYLLSEASDAITGQDICISCGTR